MFPTPVGMQGVWPQQPSTLPLNAVELANEVGRNKPAQAGVSGKLADEMPETVASRPYSGLRQILTSTALGWGCSLNQWLRRLWVAPIPALPVGEGVCQQH